MSRFQSVEEYKSWIDSLPEEAFRPDNGADTLVTYSGRDRQNRNLAEQSVASDPDNKYAIENTPAGASLEQDKLWEADSPLKDEEAHEVWRHASEKTMQHAEASKMETHVVDAKHDGVFRGTELHTALSNPNIKTINDVPCEQHMAQYDPKKIHESVAESELVRDEKRVADADDLATRDSLRLDDRQEAQATWQEQGDQYDDDRQQKQDVADANFQEWRNSPEGQEVLANAQGLEAPPPPPPPPPPKQETSAPSQGQSR